MLFLVLICNFVQIWTKSNYKKKTMFIYIFLRFFGYRMNHLHGSIEPCLTVSILGYKNVKILYILDSKIACKIFNLIHFVKIWTLMLIKMWFDIPVDIFFDKSWQTYEESCITFSNPSYKKAIFMKLWFNIICDFFVISTNIVKILTSDSHIKLIFFSISPKTNIWLKNPVFLYYFFRFFY